MQLAYVDTAVNVEKLFLYSIVGILTSTEPFPARYDFVVCFYIHGVASIPELGTM